MLIWWLIHGLMVLWVSYLVGYGVTSWLWLRVKPASGKKYPALEKSNMTMGQLAEQSIHDHERIDQIERRLHKAGITM